jgi:hypothetical protein
MNELILNGQSSAGKATPFGCAASAGAAFGNHLRDAL